MKKVNVGIIGAGRIGQLHANNILNSDLLCLKAISDIELDHLSGTIIEKNVDVITSNPEDIFDDASIDAVFICSSTDTHADFIKKSALAGKHIFCEKPVSFNLNDTKVALKAVEESGVLFQAGFNRRFDKNFRKIYETIQAGKIGEPHIIRVSSRDPGAPPEDYIKSSGGMFMDMTIHDFDMVRFLADSNVVDISVKATNLVDPVFKKYDDVDTAVITLTFENGAIGVIDNSREAVYGYDQRIEVFGNKGVVSAENEKKTNMKLSTVEGTYLENPKHFFLDRYKDAYVDEINEFAKSILNNSALSCTGEDGYQAELLAYAARLSWLENRSVTMSEIELINI